MSNDTRDVQEVANESTKIGQPVSEYLSTQDKAHVIRVVADAVRVLNLAIEKGQQTGLSFIPEVGDNKVSVRVKS